VEDIFFIGLGLASMEAKCHIKHCMTGCNCSSFQQCWLVAGYVINLTISRGEQTATEQRAQSEREATEKRAETEREIALDSQREAAFQAYINEISDLLLHENLRDSKPEEKVRKIARVRTLTVLSRLDKVRKWNVLQFLCEADLIYKYR
jgi:hypothetical protein